jgi:hypothetical protein
MRVFLLVLFLFPAALFARDYPAVSGYLVNGVCGVYGGFAEACAADGGWYGENWYSKALGCWRNYEDGKSVGYDAGVGTCKDCPYGGSYNYGTGICTGASECEEGKVVSDKGACVVDCELVKGEVIGSYDSIFSGTCIAGCRVTTNSSQCGYTNEGVKVSCEYHGPFTLTGESCTPENPAECDTIEVCDENNANCKRREVCKSDDEGKDCGTMTVCTGEGENKECHDRLVCDEDNNKDCTTARVCTGEGEEEVCKDVQVCNEDGGEDGGNDGEEGEECEGEDCEGEGEEGESDDGECEGEDCDDDDGFELEDLFGSIEEKIEDAFFKDVFDDVLSWNLPSCGGQCLPVRFDLRYFNRTFVMESHCDIARDVMPYFSSVMVFVWSIYAIYIVLRA